MATKIKFVCPVETEWKEFEISQEKRFFKVGFGSKCDVVLPSRKGVDEEHLVLSYDSDQSKYSVMNSGSDKVFVSNKTTKVSQFLTPGEKCYLGAKCTLTFGVNEGNIGKSLVVYWEDSECYEEVLQNYKRISIDVEKDDFYAVKTREIAQNIIGRITNCVAEKYFVSQVVLKYIYETYDNLSTLILYQNCGEKWKHIFALRADKNDKYRPTATLFLKCVKEKTPILSKREGDYIEVNDEKFEITQSIAEMPSKRIVLFPIIQKDKVIGILYADSKEDTINEEFIDIIYRVFNVQGVGYILSGYLKEDQDDTDFLKIRKEDFPIDWGWRLYVSKTYGYPLAGFRTIENLGEARFFYGFCGDELKEVLKVKSFVMGMMKTSLTEDKNYIEKVNEFCSDYIGKRSCEFIDIRFTYSVDNDEDGFGDFREIKLGNDKNEDFRMDIAFCGKMNIYFVKGNEIIEVTQGVSGEDGSVSRVSFSDVEVGSAIICSPSHRVPLSYLKNLKVDNLKKKFRNFMILAREK